MKISEKLLYKSYTNYPDCFFIKDSIELDYTLDAFPSIIFDICKSDSSYYILGKSNEFPLCKFDQNGRFVKTIGIIGNGPGEFPVSPSKVTAYHDYLAVCNPQLNTVTLFKNDYYVLKKTFPTEYRISDILFINNDRLLISCFGKSKKMLLLVNNKMEVVASDYNLPTESEFAVILL